MTPFEACLKSTVIAEFNLQGARGSLAAGLQSHLDDGWIDDDFPVEGREHLFGASCSAIDRDDTKPLRRNLLNTLDVAGHVYHMLNRANRRQTIFEKEGDYEAFERILIAAVNHFEVDLFSYCLMPNHWHLVVRPNLDREMSRFAQWLTLTHTQRYHAHYGSAGEGHLYQGRYKSFPVQGDDHLVQHGT